MRELGFFDIGIAGFAAFVGALAIKQALELWRLRNGGKLLRALVFLLCSFAAWSLLVFSDTLYIWHAHLTVSKWAQGMAALDRLLISVPMAIILICILPAIGKGKE